MGLRLLWTFKNIYSSGATCPLTLLRGGDKIIPSYTFDNNYVICIPNKDDWLSQIIRIPGEIVCYTDGSRLQRLDRTGASVLNQTTNLKLTLPLGNYSTVFQAEIYAILACVLSLHSEREVSIAICSDSKMFGRLFYVIVYMVAMFD